MAFISESGLKCLPLIFSIAVVSFIKGLLIILVDNVHFELFLQISLHVFELIVKLYIDGLTWHLVEENIDSHWKVLGVIIFDSQECRIGLVVIVLDR